MKRDSPNPFIRLLFAEYWTDGTLIGLKDDCLAGLTIAVTQVPQAIAFAVLAKMAPKFGLFSTFYLGLIMSVFGARSGAIYGAAGALAVEFPHLVEDYSTDAVLAATIICGLWCLVPGIFRVSDYIRLLPNSVMVGFVDGLAIVIFRGTLVNFKDPDEEWITGEKAGFTVLVMFITFAVMALMPMVTKVVPSTIFAVIIGTAFEYIFSLGTYTVGDKYSAGGSLDAPRWPGDHWSGSWLSVVGASLVFAVIGIVESLMTQILLDKANGNKTSMDREMIVFGVANIVNGFFGGMAGCALVGPTILNMISLGAKRRLAGVITSIITLFAIFFASAAIEIIPLGVLSAVTFMICLRTFDWNTFIYFYRLPPHDSLVIVIVTVVTYFTDLAIGVAAGTGFALLATAFRMRDNVHLKVGHEVVEVAPDVSENEAYRHDQLRVVTVHLSGCLFFASAPQFLRDMESIGMRLKEELSATDVILDMTYCDVQDFGGIEGIETVGQYFDKHYGLRTHMVNTERSLQVFKRAMPLLPHIIPSDTEVLAKVRGFAMDATGANSKIPTSAPFPVGRTPLHVPKNGLHCVAVAYRRLEHLSINIPMAVAVRVAEEEPVEATEETDGGEPQATENGDVKDEAMAVAVEEPPMEAGAAEQQGVVVLAAEAPGPAQGEASEVEPFLAASNVRVLDETLTRYPDAMVLKFKEAGTEFTEEQRTFAGRLVAVAVGTKVSYTNAKQKTTVTFDATGDVVTPAADESSPQDNELQPRSTEPFAPPPTADEPATAAAEEEAHGEEEELVAPAAAAGTPTKSTE